MLGVRLQGLLIFQTKLLHWRHIKNTLLVKFQFFLLLSVLFLLTACNKGDDGEPTGETPPEQYGELEVTVKLCEDEMCASTLSVGGAEVLVYPSAEERADKRNVAFSRTTDNEGRVLFTQLGAGTYWLVINLPSPDGRSKEEDVGIVERAKNQLPVLFEME